MAGALAFAGVLAGCGDDVTVADTLEVTVTPPSATIAVGSSVTLTASVTGTNANKAVNWTTSDQAKATVDANGKVTGVAAGTATITATAAADAGVKGSALITISADKGVQKVEVSPSNYILKVGEFVQATANVTRNAGVAGTVTWASSATAIATVDATGKITAVSNGSAVITAASTVDPSITGSMALTVRALTQAKISVQAVTKGGTTQPVNFNNVSGQIDVVLNVDPGDEAVTKVDVNVDGTSACSRNLSVAESEQLRLAAAFEELQAVDIVCSINTGSFNATTGAVNFSNGAHTLSASGVVAGPPQRTITTSNQPATFNNKSGFIAIVTNTNTNTGFPASAINTTTGRKWIAGTVQLKLAAVNYAGGGATVNSVSGSFLSKAFTNVAPDAGTQIFTLNFPNATTPANPLNIGGYQSPVGPAELPTISSANLSNGNQAATDILNIGASADSLGLPTLDSTRVDNAQPAAPTIAAFAPWVKAAFTFDTTKMGVSGVTDSGVDAVTVEFWVIKGAVPTASACDLTGMTKMTSSTGLAETAGPEYNTKVVILDALGNRRCATLANAFGADFGAPQDVTVDFAGTGAATTYTMNTAGDTLSGIPGSNPALLSIVRMGVTSASNACVLGTGTFAACVAVAAPSTGSATNGSSTEGYYTITGQLTDVAGNAGPTPAASKTFVVDVNAPTFTGGLVLSQTYAGNAAAQFGGITVNDNLDLNTLYGQVNYGAAALNIEFPSISIGTFGGPLEKTFSGSYTIPSLIRCMVPAGGPYTASNANKATQITIFGTDQAGLFGTNAPIAGDFTNRITADCGAAGASAVTAFTQSAPVYGTGKTEVDIDGANMATTSSTDVALEAVVTVPQNAANPFSKVEFYYLNPATNGYVLIGAATASAGPNTSPTRTHLYKLTWNPGAAVPVGSVSVIAVGVDAEGDAAPTAPQSITTVP